MNVDCRQKTNCRCRIAIVWIKFWSHFQTARCANSFGTFYPLADKAAKLSAGPIQNL